MAKIHVTTTINGEPMEYLCEPNDTMLDALRGPLGLTGSKEGCSSGDCGACSITVDGRLAVMADGHEVKTIEGLAADGAPLHPMQEAFREHHGLQCGFCTPGMIMTAVDLVHRKGNDLSDEVIREELEGNLCRCTGYDKIVRAVMETAAEMRDGIKEAAQ